MSFRPHFVKRFLRERARLSVATQPRIALRWILTIPFVVQVIGMVGLVGYLSYRSGQTAVEKLAHQLMEQTSNRIYEQLNTYLQAPHQLVKLNQLALQHGTLDSQNLAQIEQSFCQQIKAIPTLTSLSFVTVNGVGVYVGRDRAGLISPPNSVLIAERMISADQPRRFFRVDDQGHRQAVVKTLPSFEARQQIGYQATVKAQQPTWTPVYPWLGVPVAGISAGIPVYQQGQLKGVLNSDIFLSDVSWFLRSLNFSPSGQSFILDRQGRLIATSTEEPPFISHTDGNLVRLRAEASQDDLTQAATRHLLETHSNLHQLVVAENFIFKANQQRQFMQVMPYRDPYGLDWLVVVIVPESDFMATLEANVRHTVVLCGLALLGALGVGVVASQRITRSLRRLTQATQSLGAGILDQPLPPTRIAEVEILAEAFRQMGKQLQAADQLRQHYTQELEQQVAEKAAVLLEAQRIAHVASWELDLATHTVLWSEELYRIYEADPQSLTPRPDRMIQQIHPDDQDPCQRQIRVAIQNHQPFDLDMRILTQKGNVRYIQAKGQPVSDAQGEVVKWVGIIADISDRKLAEMALRQSEARYRTLSEVCPVAIFRFDQPFNCVYVNDRWSEMTGRPKEFALGRGWIETLHPDERDERLAQWSASYTQPSPGNSILQYGEGRHLRPDGSINWYYIQVAHELDAAGNTIGYIGTLTDITDRKQTEVALNQALKELNYHTENSPLATIRWNHDFRLSYWSAQAEAIFGWKAEEVLGRTLYDWHFIVEADLDYVKQAMTQVLIGASHVCCHRNYHKDGSIVHCEWYNSALVDEAGNLVSMLSLVQDVSERARLDAERQQAEAALQESEARFQTLVKNMPGMIFRYFPSADGTGSFTYVSSGAYELLELEPECLLQDTTAIWNLIHPEDVSSLQEAMAQALQNRYSGHWEGRLITPSGQLKWVQSNSRPQQTPDGLAWDGLLIDISDRKRLEQELVKNRDFRELLFNESSDALFLVDADLCRTVECNQRAVEMFEAPGRESLLQIAGHTLHKRQFTPEECVVLQQTIEQKGFWSAELEYVTHQGRVFWGDCSITPIAFGEKRFQLVRVVDISDRKQTEAALHQAKQQLEARVADLNQRNREMGLLGQMSDFLQACLTVEEAYGAMAHLVEPLFPGCEGGVFMLGPTPHRVRMVATWGQHLRSQPEFDRNACWALRRGQVHWVNPGRLGLRCSHISHQNVNAATLCMPMIAQGETLGLFYLFTETPATLPSTKQQLARTVAEQLALAIANLELRETLQQQSIRDPLTGLFNRRYLEEALIQEVALAQRQHHAIGVIMLDIDHFKGFNDTYGHDAGDHVLQRVGTLLKENVRGSDVACRYGGEEIILLLPGSSLTETQRRAEEIRQTIAQLTASYNDQPLGSLTVSLGVASFPQHGNTGTAVVQAADVALYQAKANGRNQVVVAS